MGERDLSPVLSSRGTSNLSSFDHRLTDPFQPCKHPFTENLLIRYVSLTDPLRLDGGRSPPWRIRLFPSFGIGYVSLMDPLRLDGGRSSPWRIRLCPSFGSVHLSRVKGNYPSLRESGEIRHAGGSVFV